MAEEAIAARIRVLAGEFERGTTDSHAIMSEFSLTTPLEVQFRQDRKDVAKRLLQVAARFEKGEIWVIDLPAKVYDCLCDGAAVTQG